VVDDLCHDQPPFPPFRARVYKAIYQGQQQLITSEDTGVGPQEALEPVQQAGRPQTVSAVAGHAVRDTAVGARTVALHLNKWRGAVPLEMKGSCERCRCALGANGAAFICSHECTFCPQCAEGMGRTCPNCGGELVRRPQGTHESARGSML
jgi:hypothetical protein